MEGTERVATLRVVEARRDMTLWREKKEKRNKREKIKEEKGEKRRRREFYEHFPLFNNHYKLFYELFF